MLKKSIFYILLSSMSFTYILTGSSLYAGTPEMVVQQATPSGMSYFASNEILVVGGWDDTLVWKIPDGILLRKTEGAIGLTLSGDGTKIYVPIRKDKETVIRNISDSSIEKKIPGAFEAISPDETLYIKREGASYKETFSIIKISDGSEIAQIENSASGFSKRLKISPCNRYFAAEHSDFVRIWSVKDKKFFIEEKGWNISFFSFFDNGDKVIIANDKHLKAWSTGDGKLLYDIETPDTINGADICEKTDLIACALKFSGKDKPVIIIYDLKNGKPVSSMNWTEDITGVFWSHSGDNFMASSQNMQKNGPVSMILFDTKSLSQVSKLKVSSSPKVSFSKDDSLYSYVYGHHTNTADYGIVLGKTSDGSVIKIIKCRRNDDKQMSLSPDGRYFAYGGYSQLLNIYRTSDFTLVRSKKEKNIIENIYFSNNYIAVHLEHNGVNITSIESGADIHYFKKAGCFAISPDGKLACADSGRDTPLVIYSLPDCKKLKELPESSGFTPVFSPDNKMVAVIWNDAYNPRDQSIRIWDVKSGSIVKNIPVPKFYTIGVIKFSPDSKNIVFGSDGFGGGDRIFVWDAASGSLINKITIPEKHESSPFDISAKGWIATASHYDGTIRLWDIKTGQAVKVINTNKTVDSIAFSPDGSLLFTGGFDGMQVFNITNGSHASIVTEGGEWIIYTDDGYFDSSKNGGKFIAMVDGLEGFSIDQFAVRNNRPDIIFSKVGLGSKDLIENFHQQYLKRLRKLGFVNRKGEADESLLSEEIHAPVSKITKVNTNGKKSDVSMEFSDTLYSIKRYNVFINDVPLYGAYGKEISGKKTRITETVELTNGENKIEVSCINEKGTESFRALTIANYTKQDKGDLYFIGFGVSKYSDSSLNLQYADKDAKDLAAAYSKMKDSYNNSTIKVYTNEEVTVETIKSAKGILNNAKPDDTFVLFIAGHGVHDTDSESTYYYLTYNADRNNLPGTCAKFELIEDLLQGIAPRNKLFLMDTCESGESDESVEKNYYSAAGSRGIKARTARAFTVSLKKDAVKRPYLLQRDRYIYNDLLRRSGAIVFSSSRGGEFSYESEKIQNGYFTKRIIDALRGEAGKKKEVSVEELRKYVSDSVPKDTEDLQHPVVDRDNLSVKFNFPVVR